MAGCRRGKKWSLLGPAAIQSQPPVSGESGFHRVESAQQLAASTLDPSRLGEQVGARPRKLLTEPLDVAHANQQLRHLKVGLPEEILVQIAGVDAIGR